MSRARDKVPKALSRLLFFVLSTDRNNVALNESHYEKVEVGSGSEGLLEVLSQIKMDRFIVVKV